MLLLKFLVLIGLLILCVCVWGGVQLVLFNGVLLVESVWLCGFDRIYGVFVGLCGVVFVCFSFLLCSGSYLC